MIIMGDGKKRVLTSILGPHKNDEAQEPEADELDMIAQELIEAIHARNAQDVKESLRAAFECLDSEPHEEGEHTEED